MSKRLTIFAALLTLSTIASAVTMPLPRLKYGDASLQVHNVQAMTGTPTVYLSDTNISAFTVCGWYKAEPTETVKMYGSVLAHAMVSVVSARATQEGGDKLENVLPFDQSTAVPLDASGEWSAACLPATTDPTGGGGCFVVNITCDKAVNLTIGDQSLTFAASDEMQIRNVWTSDNNNGRTIAVSTDAGATVYLGVAVNPIVRFYDVQNDSWIDGDSAQTNGGVVTNEYRFLVFRAKLDGANLTLASEAWNRAGKLVCVRTNVTAVAAKTFAKNARFSLDFGVACEGAWKKLNVHKFGFRAYSEWIDDDLLLSMRDKDWTEMTSRGLTYDGERGEAWTLVADVTTIASATGTTTSHTDEQTTLGYTTTPETRDVKRTVTLHAKSCLLDGFVVSDDEMDWSCETSGASYEQSSNVFTFAAAGQYTLRGYNRKLAAAKTISINLTDGQSYVKYELGNPSSATSPYGVACASLVETLASVNLSPLVYDVNGSVKTAAVTVCKSVPSVPIRSTAGRVGNAAVSCLSPHTWISAAHWWGLNPSTLTYTDGGAITSTVKTASGTFVFLRDWAAAQGYSAEVVKACADIAVGRFAEGAVDASLCPYLMTAQTMTNAFGTAFAVPAWRSTQTSLSTCLPVLLRGGSDGAYVDGQASEAEEWSNVGSYVATSAADYARDLVAKSVVEAVATLADKKTDKTMRLFAECYGGDSGHPTYVEPERGKFVLVTQNHTIYGGDSDAAVYNVLKAYVESEGDTIKTWSY